MLDRHQYVEKLKAKLDERDHDLATFESRVQDAGEEVKLRSQRALSDLKTARQQLGQNFAEIADASDEAWQKLRLSLDKAWDNVTSGLLSARAELLPPIVKAEKEKEIF